ncbi:unnamed protein product, partial [Ectocarpus sp. 4 AP-2014]
FFWLLPTRLTTFTIPKAVSWPSCAHTRACCLKSTLAESTRCSLRAHQLSPRIHRDNDHTPHQERFFELREKIAEAKCDCADLNITKIFSVTGKSQQRGTFNKARVANSAAVLLVSDEPNDTDVLLVSLELEQMLREIPAGQHAPKVTHVVGP